MVLFGLAALADLALGGRAALGHIPGVGKIFGLLASGLSARLNRPLRSARERAVRGTVLVVVLLPLIGWLGLYLNIFMASGRIGLLVAFTLLLLAVRVRLDWQAVLDRLANDGDPHAGARAAVQMLARSYGETLVANLVLFALGGFALLLPYRFVAALLEAGHPEGVNRPDGSFFTPAAILHNLLSLPGVLLAALTLLAAQIAIPGTSLGAVRGLKVSVRGRLIAGLWPLAILAHGLGFAFEGRRQGGRTRWLGPKDGKARLTNTDVRRAGRVIMLASALLALMMVMLTTFIMTEPT
ncbi:MAG: hypothetical protein EP335_01880 [Alphaproteobacteria bacterium]|nr:MAG: hypothetical protein EP335_01880 [Alphaproteobacteria bacterium]